MNLGTGVSIVGGMLGIAVAVGAALVVLLRSTKNEIIADLEKRVDQLKEERDDERVNCKEEIAGLKGQLEVLEGEFVTRIVTAVALSVSQHVAEDVSARVIAATVAPPRRKRPATDG